MSYSIERSDRLKKILRKLFRRDRKSYEAVLKKIEEILRCRNPHHYKNLSHDMKEFKRVHVAKHFVLTFKVDENKKTIKFYDFDHHDKVYKR